MYEIDEITQYVEKIKDAVMTGAGESAKTIMDYISISIVVNMKTEMQSYPATKPVSLVTGRLARAIQGSQESKDDGTMSDDVIVYERSILVPYANITEYGGNVFINTRMRNYMYYKYQTTKELKYLYMYLTKQDYYKHRPLMFVQDILEKIDSQQILDIISKEVEEKVRSIV